MLQNEGLQLFRITIGLFNLHRVEIDRKVTDIQERMNDEQGDEFLNDSIREEETEAGIQLLHKDKTPGPDNIYGELLKKGGEALITAINTLFNRS